jgi:hypothetical protein
MREFIYFLLITMLIIEIGIYFFTSQISIGEFLAFDAILCVGIAVTCRDGEKKK